MRRNTRELIDALPTNYVFSYKDLLVSDFEKEATIKSLNRLAASEFIIKLSKGKYYKRENSPFGALPPITYEIIKDLLIKEGEVIGYLTGLSVFNQLGLTTQVSNTIQIGKNEIRPMIKRGNVSVIFIRQKNIITSKNIPLLQVLDSIRFIKKIPNTTTEEICKRFLVIIQNLNKTEKADLTSLAKKYPPFVRALLGAIFEILKEDDLSKVLKNTLNPITKYQLKSIEKVFVNSKKWNFK